MISSTFSWLTTYKQHKKNVVQNNEKRMGGVNPPVQHLSTKKKEKKVSPPLGFPHEFRPKVCLGLAA